MPLAPRGPPPPRWAGTSVAFAAKAWNLSQRGIARRGGRVRHLWDLRWHGKNQAVANPGLANILGVCPLRGHGSCSQAHILCNCPGLVAERASLQYELTLLMARFPRGHVARLPGPFSTCSSMSLVSLIVRRGRSPGPGRLLPLSLHRRNRPHQQVVGQVASLAGGPRHQPQPSSIPPRNDPRPGSPLPWPGCNRHCLPPQCLSGGRRF